MKKISIAIALALVLAMALGSAAFAAQALSSTGLGGFNTYQATPTGSYVYDENTTATLVYNDGTGETTYTHLYKSSMNVSKPGNYFTADGYTYYPYEIYLPNEATPADYRIHTNYNKNTDACASCHATHTAVGASLLQWYSVYETCMACHDGTVTTTYNVEDGEIGTHETATFGGMFGTGSEKFASKHNVQGSVSIAAAPGGSVVAESATTTGGKTISMWNKTFGCESCHTPHGQGGNARILNPDPNGFATKNLTATYDIITDDFSTVSRTYVADATGNAITLIKGYPYTITLKDIDGNAIEDQATKFKIYNFGDSTVGSFTYIEAIGAGNISDVVYATGTAAVTVKMNIAEYLEADENVTHISGMNTYCGACHVDYNTETQALVNKNAGSNEIMGTEANRPGYGALVGTYSKAHRHAVGLDYDYGDAANRDYIGTDKLMKTMGDADASVISCLTCHFAHGTNQDFWERAIDKWYAGTDNWITADLEELSGSSALKRLPNMATCEACHQKADANQGYVANTSLTDYLQDGKTQQYIANAAHEAYFRANSYKDATTCLVCHPSAGDDVMNSAHWTVGTGSSTNKDFFGGLLEVKDGSIGGQVFIPQNGFSAGMPIGMSDRFCGFPGGAAGVSWAYNFMDGNGNISEGNSCGKCHISVKTTMPPLFLGFMGETNETMKKNIDCLPCHLDVKDYDPTVNKKVVNGALASYFDYGQDDRGGFAKVDRNDDFKVAEVGSIYKIQKPSNENCMTCHEHAMAGPVYKRHGVYSEHTDVHYEKGLSCMNCHPTSRHLIAKGTAATDLVANDRPDVEVSCTTSKCHPAAPHNATAKGNYLNTHTAKLACQACHVKTDDDSYAEATRQFVNESMEEKGLTDAANPLFPDEPRIRALFKGGAVFNDFRMFNKNFSAVMDGSPLVSGAVYGYLQSLKEFGASEWSMVQPGNYAWRWFNGTGTGMANAIASFGFYDPYTFQDGFGGFRGTTTLPGTVGDYATRKGQMAGMFGGYWSGYGNPAMFDGYNSFDKELYQSSTEGVYGYKGGNGDKIYPFRKMQAWMPVPRTNFWFLTPHDMKTVKDVYNNYETIRASIESPMMYMFFSAMFKPAMDLYAQEFGFQYMYKEQNITATVPAMSTFDASGVVPMGYFKLYWGLPAQMRAGIGQLNGYIYDKNAYWLDDCDNPAMNTADSVIAADQYDLSPAGDGSDMYTVPADENAGFAAICQTGTLGTYMYFPMPLDANIMVDHAIAAPGFDTGNSYGKYEPRTCSDCHKAPNSDVGGNAIAFDNPQWNPLDMTKDIEQDAISWGQNFKNTTTFDWVTLGYTPGQIYNLTSLTGANIFGLGSWAQYDAVE